MPVEVRPATFSMVFFDAADIAGIVEGLRGQIGLPAELPVTIDVDETTPMGRACVAGIDPVVIKVESGALEDVKHPRHLSVQGATDVLGKLLFEVRDRLDPAFGDPPVDDDLTLQESAAWEAYCVGRMGRLGHPVQRQRRLYSFRNRHGFTDAADAVFERLWTAEDLTWSDITALSQDALAALPA